MSALRRRIFDACILESLILGKLSTFFLQIIQVLDYNSAVVSGDLCERPWELAEICTRWRLQTGGQVRQSREFL